MPGIIMNGARVRKASFSSTSEPHYGAGLLGVHPGAKVLLDGYNGLLKGAHDVPQRYDIVGCSRSVIGRQETDGD